MSGFEFALIRRYVMNSCKLAMGKTDLPRRSYANS